MVRSHLCRRERDQPLSHRRLQTEPRRIGFSCSTPRERQEQSGRLLETVGGVEFVDRYRAARHAALSRIRRGRFDRPGSQRQLRKRSGAKIWLGF